jgi:dTDP-4-dehydrorhamnose 3,5-epimerase
LSRFEIYTTPLAGLNVVRRKTLKDARGSLSRIFCSEELAAIGWSKSVSQINHTYTSLRGTLRGLHYQIPPHAEAKLVTTIQGAVWDVAVDIRAGSPTFGQAYGCELSAENQCALLIPQGFAHGFQALQDNVHIIYLHSEPYSENCERGLNALDPAMAIHWPLPITLLSERDRGHALLATDFKGVAL